MKDYLVYNGVEVSLPRDVMKQAFHHQLIQDGQIWIDISTLYIFRMRVSQDFDLQALVSLCNRLEHAIAETDKRL